MWILHPKSLYRMVEGCYYFSVPNSRHIYRFLTDSGGLKIDQFEISIRLAYLVPENLPVFGVKTRAYYHGMPKQLGLSVQERISRGLNTWQILQDKAFHSNTLATG